MENCTETAQGATSTSSVTIMVTSTGAQGTESLTIGAPDGGVIATCTYSITVTKQ
jgi:hypothetical protein